jgi:hypothetical protein
MPIPDIAEEVDLFWLGEEGDADRMNLHRTAGARDQHGSAVPNSDHRTNRSSR